MEQKPSHSENFIKPARIINHAELPRGLRLETPVLIYDTRNKANQGILRELNPKTGVGHETCRSND